MGYQSQYPLQWERDTPSRCRRTIRREISQEPGRHPYPVVSIAQYSRSEKRSSPGLRRIRVFPAVRSDSKQPYRFNPDKCPWLRRSDLAALFPNGWSVSTTL